MPPSAAAARTTTRPGTTRPCRSPTGCRWRTASRSSGADGRDGAAGLRPVRLRLRTTTPTRSPKARSPPEPVRAGRQGDLAHGEDAGRGARRRHAGEGRADVPRQAPTAARRQGRGRAWLRARQARRRALQGRRRLNKLDSEKATFHIEIDLTAAGIEYVVGDSFGLFPQNDPALVDTVIAAIDAPRDFPIGDKTLREVLPSDVSLGTAPDSLFELISYITGGERRAQGQAARQGRGSRRRRATPRRARRPREVPGLRPDPEAFVECLDPLQPRLYSISSSHNATPDGCR